MELKHAAHLINEHVGVIMHALEHFKRALPDDKEVFEDASASAEVLRKVAREVSEKVFGISRSP